MKKKSFFSFILVFLFFSVFQFNNLFDFLYELRHHQKITVVDKQFEIQSVNYTLTSLVIDSQKRVWGARGKVLYRIINNGDGIEKIHSFKDQINCIHIMTNNIIIVATDANWWDTKKPCNIYSSLDNGKRFELIKTIHGGSAIRWSIASDKRNNLYVGEYGPKEINLSKRVWASNDFGKSWRVIFQAPNQNGVHIHRVAVDPYTDNLWITNGDTPEFSGTYLSTDQGSHWTYIRNSAATAVLFTKNSIYWGKDSLKGEVTEYDRHTKQFQTVLDASDFGNYGGSIYSIAAESSGLIVVPMMKYPGVTHLPTLWIGNGKKWNLEIIRKVSVKSRGGFESITPPDQYGYLYIPGYKIRDIYLKIK